MDVIYHIKALHRQGLTTREIAAALKINRESVLKYIKQPVIIRSPIKREKKTAINPYLPLSMICCRLIKPLPALKLAWVNNSR